MIEYTQSEIRRKEHELTDLSRKCSEFLKKEQEINRKICDCRNELTRRNLRDNEISSKERDISNYQRDLERVMEDHAYCEHQRESISKSLEDLHRQFDSEQRWQEFQKRQKEEEEERLLNRKRAAEQAKTFAAASQAKSNQSAQTGYGSQNYNSASTAPRKKSGRGKVLLYVLIGLFALSFLSNIFNRDNSASNNRNANPQADSSGIDFEYTNVRGQVFSFHCDNPDTVIYEKTVDALIAEWTDNVALAEKTYNQPNVAIVTEGYIQNINKASDDEYYILLSTGEDSGLFSTEELRIYFRSESALDALFTIKKGDYLTLVCSVQDTTFFLEYPELEAKLVLEAMPVSDTREGLAAMIGLKVSDIVSQYGDGYIVDSWQGGTYFTYENCPYNFYYSTPEYDSDWQPHMDDTVFGVETLKTGIAIDGEIYTGSASLEDVEAWLGYDLDLVDDYDYEGNCGTASINLSELEYRLTFDRDTDTLISASCWTVFEAPNHPDVIPENINKLVFNYGSDDVDFVKKEFILCLIQEDINAYHQGGKSLYDWSKDFNTADFEWANYWHDLIDDLEKYLAGNSCEYAERWELGESAFYAYASGQLGDKTDSTANAINNVYPTLGELR